jgi:hypothetical protein
MTNSEGLAASSKVMYALTMLVALAFIGWRPDEQQKAEFEKH